MADNVAQHFRKDEAPFIETATGWIQQASDEYRPILTLFFESPAAIHFNDSSQSG